jgi:beta-lactamase superfamily II metal-dependent hydrolase
MQGMGDDQGDDTNKRQTNWQPDEDQPKNKRPRRTSNVSTENPYAIRRKSFRRQTSSGGSRTRGDAHDINQQKMADEKKRKDEEMLAYEQALSDERKNRTRAPDGQRGDGKLHIVFIQMGQGDCAMITTPEGKSILVDCGTTATEEASDAIYNARIRDIICGPKFMKNKNKLDMLILTHPDRDHYAKIKAILEGIVEEIGVFYHSCKFSGYSFNETSTWIDNILGTNFKIANKQVTCCDDGGHLQYRQITLGKKSIYSLPNPQLPNEQLDNRGAIRILLEPDPKSGIASTTTTTISSPQPPVGTVLPMNVDTTQSVTSPPPPVGANPPTNVTTTHTVTGSPQPPVSAVLPMDTTNVVSTSSTSPAGSVSAPPHSALTPSSTHPISTTPPPDTSTDTDTYMVMDMDIDLNLDLDLDLNVDLHEPPPPSITIPQPPPSITIPQPQPTTQTAITATTVPNTCAISILASNVYILCQSIGLAYRDDNTNNKHSIVLLIEAYGRRIMICGDATGGTEEFIMRAYPDVKDLDMLQVPHHGSDRTSSTAKFVARMNPENCIISAPRDARQHGHPCAQVIEAYRNNSRMRKDLPEHTIYYKERDEIDKTQKSSIEEKITDAIYITGSYGSCAVTVFENGQLTISTLELASNNLISTATTTQTIPTTAPQPMSIDDQ